jgi:O-antigen/teichoic acid export membrane protein
MNINLQIDKLFSFFKKGNERSLKAKRNILYMLLFKGGNIAIGFILLPLTVGYVDSTNYGIWLAISSIVAWMSFFDVGLNNGLRNKFAECKANGDLGLAQKYVSTTYALLSLIFIPLLVIFLLINPFINWSTILNIKEVGNLNTVVAIVVSYFSLSFILSTINVILSADQRPAAASLRTFVQQLASLLVIFILTKTTNGSLLLLSIALCIIPLIIIIYYNIVFFHDDYREVKPSFKKIDFSLTKQLLGLGYKFFVIQIAAVVLYQTMNFIIIRYFGAEKVTQYNVAYKYFSALTMAFSILIAPVWSAVTDAWVKDDITWIQNILKKYTFVGLGFIILGFAMLLCSNIVYSIWMGNSIKHIDFSLSLCIYIYIAILLMGNFYANVLNGTGMLKLQFISSIISPFIFIALCYLFIKILHLEVYSVVLACILSNAYSIFISPLQCYLLFYKNKRGIWSA